MPQGFYNAHHLFVIEVEQRKALYDFLRTKNIYAQIHYIPIHTMPYYKQIGYEGADLNTLRTIIQSALVYPCIPPYLKQNKNISSIQYLSFWMNKCIAIIPARGGSKRISPKKHKRFSWQTHYGLCH